ncbi:GntR family transcriptional regulator [Pelagicoccus sp. NFK12]|uniref:GntR family transcriptional regulator n=1 Tax=Pelagicoccus enzymogenes TaxID=2773457 RepID=A0A927IHJ9_9BACT|nr:S1-like domain-containing RNA-binding protein [Pelagicoccus enzymogenes]MBD5779894.1 GntR family transcriptional regulator [Pelagicoccus enzymogenes]MDQ8200760.1 S1-like domain-containing RNA-binding protein [Pelagicoccus enzymogenes]
MAELGKRNTLSILNESPHGLYLDGEELGDILLPNAFVPKRLTPSQKLSVFVYLDSEDRIVATTEEPLAEVDEFAALKVVEVHEKVGAFLDWGLSKDLLLPYREQKGRVQVGDTRVVRIYVDDASGRIVASEKHARFLSKYRATYKPQEQVDLIVVGETPLGYKAIINSSHIGLLYDNELSEPLSVGQRFKGYVNKVRPDGNIDLRRDLSGYTRVAPLAEQILDTIKAKGGSLDLDDRSSPEAIREAFDVSKKAFKQALGNLYKQRLIEFVPGGVKLTEK